VGAVIVLAAVVGVLLYQFIERWHRPPIESWAVLPLEVPDGDSMYAHVAEGIASSLTGRLSELKTIRVIAWESSRRYDPSIKTLPQIARELGAQGLVTGVARFGGSVRVEIQLSDGPANRQLGRGLRRVGELDEIPIFQERLEREVAKRVVQLAKTGEKPSKLDESASESAATDYYQHARFLWERRPDSLFRSIEYFEKAIREDAGYAPAHAGLSDAWSAVGLYALRPPLEARRMARSSARRAVDLAPGLSTAHTSLAHVLHNYEWDWEGALAEYRRAIALNPNDAAAHHGLAHLLAQLGRTDEALREIRIAVALNPRSVPTLLAVGVVKYYARDYAGALDTLRAVAVVDSNNVLRHRLSAAVLDRLGRGREAVEEVARATERSGQPGLAKGLRQALAAQGVDGAIRVLIGALIQKRASGAYVPAEQVAELYSRLGQVEKALEWLEISFREHDTELNRLKADPLFDPMREDPRFVDLMKRVGFMDVPS
jgi:tetratricopeptide (TPR) repeat protein